MYFSHQYIPPLTISYFLSSDTCNCWWPRIKNERKSSVFCNITPCSPLEVNRHFGVTYHLHLESRGVSQSRNQHKASIKTVCLPETSVDLHRTTRSYITEDRILHSRRCENLKYNEKEICVPERSLCTRYGMQYPMWLLMKVNIKLKLMFK
jgi:hypothetical protein